MLKKIAIVLLLVIAALLAHAATRPDTFGVTHSAHVSAPAPVGFEQLADFRKWDSWSPWEKLDLNMQRSYEGDPGSLGSKYAWKGNAGSRALHS
jgi:hypothetical protein